ncbi:MAG TPA: hypothetical protein VHS96_03690 [Bacteroidia bacterium]|nr:hypothetical protein [Bacteroidia bacterium]
MARTHSNEFFHCNNCGGEVSLKAKVCPHCGADDETAWKDGINSYVVEEQEDFDYDEYVRTNQGNANAAKPKGTKWWVWVIAILLLSLFAWRMFA